MINKSFAMDNESLPIKGETRHLFKSETGYMNLLQSSDQGSCSLFRNYYSPSFRAELKTVPLNFVVNTVLYYYRVYYEIQ